MAAKRADTLILLAHLAGRRIADIATEAGVSERTVRRRLADPAFRRQVDEARAELQEACYSRLSSMSNKVTSKLETLVDAKNQKISLAACRTVLEFMSKMRETAELVRRIEDLERQEGEGK